MTIWDSVITVTGTLGGLLVGYWISFQMESRRRKHERGEEYSKEIKKHMDDIIKPLFSHLQNLWGDLGVLQEYLRHKSSMPKGMSLNGLLLETKKANQTLQAFVNSKYIEMSLLLPNPFPWVFVAFDEFIEFRIIEPILQGKKPIDDITLAVNTAMKIQQNLRRIVGYETHVEIESIYPFKKDSRKISTQEEKVKRKNKKWLTEKRRKWLTARTLTNCLVISLAVLFIAYIFELARTVLSSDLPIPEKIVYFLFVWIFMGLTLVFMGFMAPELMETIFDMLGFKEKKE